MISKRFVAKIYQDTESILFYDNIWLGKLLFQINCNNLTSYICYALGDVNIKIQNYIWTYRGGC